MTTSGVFNAYYDPMIDGATRTAAGADGALWITSYADNSIIRVTMAGAVTVFSDPSINGPTDITAGADGAMWFTNYVGQSIGRITTTGDVTAYYDPSIEFPYSITDGPDGALWFTNIGNNTIGRIAPAHYQITGFAAPVDNPPLVNVAKAGRSVPVKWRLLDGQGNPVNDPNSFASITSGNTTCSPNSPTDDVETYTGGSGLQPLGDGWWQFNWQTPKSYVGQCRTMMLKLSDGSSLSALVSFK